jgi:hypothetical protein
MTLSALGSQTAGKTVTPRRYGIHMMQMRTPDTPKPDTSDDRAIVALFAEAGLTVEIVDSCDCSRCRGTLRPAA